MRGAGLLGDERPPGQQEGTLDGLSDVGGFDLVAEPFEMGQEA